MSKNLLDKWLTENGFHKEVYNTNEDNPRYGSYKVETRTVWSKRNGKIHMRVDHEFYKVINKRNNKISHRSNWYSVYGYGNRYKIDNNITYRCPKIEDLEMISKIIGL